MKETLINNNTTETKDYFHILTTLYAKAKIKLSKQTAENKDLNDRLKSLEVFYLSLFHKLGKDLRLQGSGTTNVTNTDALDKLLLR